MKKRYAVSVLVAMFVIATAATAFAGFTWCSTDPNIKLPGNGGVFHLWESVPVGYEDVPFVLKVSAPEGSRIVGNPSSRVNVTVELLVGDDGWISAELDDEHPPVILSGKYKGKDLGTFEFDENESGTASWEL
jgi:hypothetical protein